MWWKCPEKNKRGQLEKGIPKGLGRMEFQDVIIGLEGQES